MENSGRLVAEVSRGLLRTEAYAGGVDDAVNALDRLGEDIGLRVVGNVIKVIDLDKVELAGVLRPGLDHGLALSKGPGCATDSDAPAEQLVDDMGADEAGCAGDKDVLSVLVSKPGPGLMRELV